MGRLFWIILVSTLLAGCGSGAVVFAPTPLPPDLSPLTYEHPSGAFTVSVPRHWPVFTQYATTLAAASFAPPDSPIPLVTLAVVNMGQPVDAPGLNNLLNLYQQEIRTDAARYKEESREAMGDGSWRLTGLRSSPGGATWQTNTFIERDGSLVGILEIILPDDPALRDQLQAVINSFRMNPSAELQPTDLSVLVSLAASSLEILNVKAWTTPGGVFYITGEVANYGTQSVTGIPVRAILSTAEGLPVAEAVDVPMGYTLLPGGFAPFSLRFGQGQPALAASYEIILGSPDWQPRDDAPVYGPDDLSWIDESRFNDAGELVVSGTITNIGQQVLRAPRVTATVFDSQRDVAAARYIDLDTVELRPNESTSFEIIVPEVGGEPAEYVVNVQALPAP